MELADIFKQRRAVIFFDPEAKITTAQLKAIYDDAKLAPSSFNLQPFRVIAAVSKEAKEELFKVAFMQPKVKEASATLVIVGDTTKYEHAEEVWDDMVEKGYVPADKKEGTIQMAADLYGDERGPAFASRNAGLFAMALMLAAKDHGFDTHPMDGIDIDGIRKLYDLKENELPVMLIAVGRFDQNKTLLPPKMRREFEKAFDLK